jgi:hypoxanthine phosphoribosyltransferase
MAKSQAILPPICGKSIVANLMIDSDKANRILAEAKQIYSAADVSGAIAKLAIQISDRLKNDHPLVLSVMGGAVFFSGQLLPLLDFPLEFEAIHISRYGGATSGGNTQWRVMPKEPIAGRTILVLDDILDEGHTLKAIHDKMIELGAKQVVSAVLVEKDIGRSKPIRADFVGLTVPNEYVFGCGMDVYGAWRNLPAIYALHSEK